MDAELTDVRYVADMDEAVRFFTEQVGLRPRFSR